MTIPLVDLKAQYASIAPEIDAAIARVIASTSFIGGAEVRQFEAAFAEFQGAPRCVGIASGTAALYLALKVLGVGAGDEVITTPHTFIATVEPIEALGAVPVFVDIDPRTFNLDVSAVEAAITPRTRAILPVHLYGQMAPMDALCAIAGRHRLAVIEDAAQAHGASWKGKRAGSWGHIACFSFYPGKNLGAYGDGGAICTHDQALADQIAKLRDHGRASKYAHDIIGYGERLDALQAAILGAKLPHLADWTAARQRIAARYDALLEGAPAICTPYRDPAGEHVWHIYCVAVSGDRDGILAALRARGVEAGVHYPLPLHLQPALAHLGYREGDFPITEQAARTILSLPIYPEMTDAQIEHVAAALREVT
jgi:dTDP-4-amino-4,6-dideoxygalactose transaminase